MIGQRLLHYEILELLGEGGMGVVYKAIDTHLDRPVAIKVLSAKLINLDRKRRFVQEAKAASALNHPNIVTVYDINSDGGVDFIAMEFVAGRTLTDLIPRKGLTQPEALRLAVQMAAGLAKAHSAGIIHRDFKPGNVMVTPDGTVKILDFGLAKLAEQREAIGQEDATLKIDNAAPQTEDGAIVGTISYMSPEQAEGKKADARSDIFSFGSVLYEMVSGRRAFEGESKMLTLAAVLNREPKPLEGIPRDLDKIVRRSLRKDASRRFQNMADLKVALEELKEESESGAQMASTAVTRRLPRTRIAIGGGLVLAMALALWAWRSRSTGPPAEVVLQPVPLTSYDGEEDEPSFSPDGNQVAFRWDGEKHDNLDIYVQVIGSGQPLRLTTDPKRDFGPAWSPDGRWIAFERVDDGQLYSVILIPPLGGPERKLAGNLYRAGGAQLYKLTWSADSKWIVAADMTPGQERGLFALSIESGERKRLTSVPPNYHGDDNPAISPDGRSLAFMRRPGLETGDLWVIKLSSDMNPDGQPRQVTTLDRQYPASPVWTPDGRDILFVGLAGQRYAARVPADGSAPPRKLAGIGQPGSLAIARQPSKGGYRLAYSQGFNDSNIWELDLADTQKSGFQKRSLISSSRIDNNPQYSPDGGKIAFESGRSGSTEVWVCDSSGRNPVQLTSLLRAGTPRWSPDGATIAFDSNLEGQWDVYVISSNGGKPRRLTVSPADDYVPSWSRDGKWVYYTSTISTPYQVWKIPAAGGEPVQVTKDGGHTAFESIDGQFVFYTKTDASISPLWKVPTQGGDETKVLDSVYLRSLDLNETGLYFLQAPGTDGFASIGLFRFSDGSQTTLATVGRPAYQGLAVSRDGRSLLYAQIDRDGSDLMLVEGFR